MAGERKGKAYEAVVKVALQELKRRWDPQNLFRYGIDLTGD